MRLDYAFLLLFGASTAHAACGCGPDRTYEGQGQACVQPRFNVCAFVKPDGNDKQVCLYSPVHVSHSRSSNEAKFCGWSSGACNGRAAVDTSVAQRAVLPARAEDVGL